MFKKLTLAFLDTAVRAGGGNAQTGIITDWIKNLVVNWLAKAIGVDPAIISAALDLLVIIAKEFFKFFGQKGGVKVLQHMAQHRTAYVQRLAKVVQAEGVKWVD